MRIDGVYVGNDGFGFRRTQRVFEIISMKSVVDRIRVLEFLNVMVILVVFYGIIVIVRSRCRSAYADTRKSHRYRRQKHGENTFFRFISHFASRASQSDA